MFKNYHLETAPFYITDQDQTLVILTQAEPYRYLQFYLDGNHADKSEQAVKALCHEQLYKEEFHDKYLDETLEGIKQAQAEQAKEIAEIKAAVPTASTAEQAEEANIQVWEPNKDYPALTALYHDGKTYKTLKEHKSTATGTPDLRTDLYEVVS